VRIYYGPDGRPRGYSRRLLGTWLWHGSLIGLFIQFCLAVFLIPLYYFPRAVWHSRLEPLAEVAIIGGVWGGLILLGVIANAHTASQARALGCIDIATARKDYYDPSGGDNRCPDGYELAPSSLTCASITATPTQYGTPIGADPSETRCVRTAISRRPSPALGTRLPTRHHSRRSVNSGSRVPDTGARRPGPIFRRRWSTETTTSCPAWTAR
jgi:hypothetical protein